MLCNSMIVCFNETIQLKEPARISESLLLIIRLVAVLIMLPSSSNTFNSRRTVIDGPNTIPAFSNATSTPVFDGARIRQQANHAERESFFLLYD